MNIKPVCLAESFNEAEGDIANTVVWGVKTTNGVATTRTLYAINPSLVKFNKCEEYVCVRITSAQLNTFQLAGRATAKDQS